MAGALVILPAVVFGIPNNNDLANHYHFAIPFHGALSHGDWYPSLFASSNLGYGDVVVRFYPPALYYLLSASRFIVGNWYAGSLLTITVVSSLGSLGAYVWARCYLPKGSAVAAAFFYALMPYHLAEFYQAAQLAEFAAGAALMFALAFSKRVCERNRWRDVAGLAAAYAALILTHLPLAVFGSLTLALYASLDLVRRYLENAPASGSTRATPGKQPVTTEPGVRDGKPRMRTKSVWLSLGQLAAAAVVGLGGSAFYWLTMMSELKWIVADGAHPDPMLDYNHNFIFSTFSAEKQETIWWMGLLAVVTILMIMPALFPILKQLKSRASRRLLPLCGILLFAFFMSTAASKPLWAFIPYLRMTQHPFRWLAVASVAGAVLMGTSLQFWRVRLQTHLRPLALVMGGFVLISIAFSLTQTVRGATFLSKPEFDRIVAPLETAPGIIQWLPVWARDAAKGKPSYEKCSPPETKTRVEAGSREVQILDWSDGRRTFEVSAGAERTARLAMFYYPHWQASANGSSLSTSAAPDGALLIALPPEAARVTIQFREPLSARLADLISIISWTIIASVLIFGTFAATRQNHESTAY